MEQWHKWTMLKLALDRSALENAQKWLGAGEWNKPSSAKQNKLDSRILQSEKCNSGKMETITQWASCDAQSDKD